MASPDLTGSQVMDRADSHRAPGTGSMLARLALISALSGALTGVVGAAFRASLTQADTWRDMVIAWAHQWPAIGWLLPTCLAALLVAVAHWMVKQIAPLAAGSGVQHVEAVMRNRPRWPFYR